MKDDTTGGVDVRGGAPGTRETDVLSPVNNVQIVNAKLDRTFGRMRVELEARNLFDEKYSYVASILNDFRGRPNVLEFPAPGRTARVNLAWRY